MSNIIQRQKRLQSDVPVAPQSPYQELYGLRENPFPVMALFSPASDDPRQNGRIYDTEFRLEEEEQFFKRFVQPDPGNTALRLGFVSLDPQAGGRGNGKSSFLHHLMRRVNEQQWNGWANDPDSPELFALAVHVLPEPRKQRRFWQLCRLIFETLAEQQSKGHSLLVEIDINFRAAVLIKMLNQEQQEELSRRDGGLVMTALKTIDGFVDLLGEYGLTMAGFRDEGLRQIREICGDVIEATFKGSYRESNLSLGELWSSWQECGLALSDAQWRKNGASWLVDGLAPILLVAGYRRFIVLLDEFEKIYIYQTSREREEFLDEVRQRFFEQPSCAVRRSLLSLVLTIHPSIQRFLRDVWTRVGLEGFAPLDPERMREQAVELGASNIENLKHMLGVYLDAFRVASEHRGTLYPFADDALDKAFEAAKFYPRGTLWYACHILKSAAEQRVPFPISADFVRVFIESGIMPAAETEASFFDLPVTDSRLAE